MVFSRSGSPSYRLPTEAEWEYACRAGTGTPFSLGSTLSPETANTGLSGQLSTTPVGTYPPNPWGLYDVHGNVWEWCRDAKRTYTAADYTDEDETISDNTRVMRGGSWRYSPANCRAAYRSRNMPAYRGCNCGFRVCFRPDCFQLPV